MLTETLAPNVSARTRAKGLHYFRSGAVIDAGGAEWVAHALVRGTRDYRVELVRDRNRITGSCECPYYADRAEICKHIWAGLLEAERRLLLSGDGPVEAGAILEPEYHPSALVGSTRGPGVSYSTPGAKALTPPKPPAWQSFLHELQQDVTAAERAVPLPRFSNGEIIYTIDVRETLAGRGTVVNVLFRQRRKNGAWSKAKAVTLTPLEAEHMLDPDDREILSLLIGAGHTWTYGGMYDASYQRLSRYVLNGPLEDRVLPMLARSGRGHLDRVGDEVGLFPLTWDDGPAWRFDLEIGVDGKHDGIVVDGAFVRDGERLALRDPVLLLGRGFLFTRTSMARLELDGGFAWLARLRSVGPITIPRNQSGALLETLARSGLHPRSLPPELRYDVFDGDPKPRVRVNRPERQNPYALRQDLRATVLFDYDGVTVEAPPGATAYDAERRRLVRRNRSAEQTAIDRLHQLGFRYTWSHFESRQVLGISPDQFPRVVRTLVDEGWRVEAEGRAFRAADSMRLEVSSGIDWFELHGTGRLRRGPIRAVPATARGARARRGRVVLDDGTRRDGAGGVAAPLRRRSRGSATVEGDHVRFRRSQAALLDALLEAQPAIAYRRSVRRVRARARRRSAASSRSTPPPSFPGTLRDYQREALGWFAFLRRFGFGGCLADDMGLGKTVMVLALLEARRAARTNGRTRPVARRRAAVARLQLDGGGGALRAGAARARLHRRRARDRPRSPTTIWCSRPTARCGATPRELKAIAVRLRRSSTRRRRSRTRRPRRRRRRGCCARGTGWR